MPRKALLCVLQLDVRSITCPGVLLKDKEKLYLSVSVLGQYKKTRSVPAVFPLVFQEKLVFEKAFTDIVDPGDLVELLEVDTAVLELVQLVPPGKILATYEENTRDFLFPDPKLTRGHHGLDREILMKRSSSFTGIAPKLRFSTSSLIKESLLNSGRSHVQELQRHGNVSNKTSVLETVSQNLKLATEEVSSHLEGASLDGQAGSAGNNKNYAGATPVLCCGRGGGEGDLNRVHHSTPNRKLQANLPKKNVLSPEKSRRSLTTKNYEQPTIASKSRSPSPYTKRRMCELSEEARQRLAHLNLGPYEFRRETDKPPFVVRRIEQPSPGIKLHTSCPMQESAAEAWTKIDYDPSLLGSYRPKKAKTKPAHGKYSDSSDVCDEDVIPNPPSRQARSAGLLERSPPPAFQKHSPSSVLNRSSLRERFSSAWSSPANGDEIHKRVKNILRTHSARQRLVFDESNSSKGDLIKTREFFHKAPLSMSELQSSSPVRRNLDNGEDWSGPASVYKGKPHRVIFEESLEKIYRNMYQKASGTVSGLKTNS